MVKMLLMVGNCVECLQERSTKQAFTVQAGHHNTTHGEFDLRSQLYNKIVNFASGPRYEPISNVQVDLARGPGQLPTMFLQQ